MPALEKHHFEALIRFLIGMRRTHSVGLLFSTDTGNRLESCVIKLILEVSVVQFWLSVLICRFIVNGDLIPENGVFGKFALLG
jgi:hypothetical protein